MKINIVHKRISSVKLQNNNVTKSLASWRINVNLARIQSVIPFRPSFRGKKIKTPALVQKPFFSLQTHLGTYEHLYSFERLLNDLFRAIFAFVRNRIIRF